MHKIKGKIKYKIGEKKKMVMIRLLTFRLFP